MPYLVSRGYINKTFVEAPKSFSPEGGICPTRKLSDTEVVRQGSSTKSGVVRLGFVGQLQCRTTSKSDSFLHLVEHKMSEI